MIDKRGVLKWSILGVLVVGVIAYNYQYFTWDIYYPRMTDEEKFSGANWQKQLTSSIFDYLPIYAPLPPVEKPMADLMIIIGSGIVIGAVSSYLAVMKYLKKL